MITRPQGAMSKASAFLVVTIVAACPPATSDTLTLVIDSSLEECSSNLKENATGWQRLQLVLALEMIGSRSVPSKFSQT